MKLDISAPSYFSQYNTVDEEIIEMSNDIMDFMERRSYSEDISVMDVIPVVAPPQKINIGLWKEDVMLSRSINRVSIFKHIDFFKYMNGTVEERKELTVKCIIEAAGMLKKKSRIKFDAMQFEADLLRFLQHREESPNEPYLNKEFRLRTNGEAFRDRIASPYAIKEAINYIEKQTYAGNADEFLVLSNDIDNKFIQTYIQTGGFYVEFSTDEQQDNCRRKQLYKSGLSKKEIINLLCDFYQGNKLDIKGYRVIT